MKVVSMILTFALSCFGDSSDVSSEEFKLAGLFFGCDRDVTSEYHRDLQDFSTRLYKQVASQNDYHFALSQYSIWLSLSAIAEGSTGAIQQQLFKSLNLPQDSCLREKYYEIATSLESPGNDVTLSRKRLLILDDILKVNKTWIQTVRASGLVDTKIVALNSHETTNQLRQLIGLKMDLNAIGNSIILDSLDYEGLWTTAFGNSSKEKEDFFDDNGVKIGTVEMLRIQKRVKLAHLPFLNAKLLELPVGNNGRYRMLYIINLGKNTIAGTINHFPNTMIIDSLPLLVESLVPLEVAVPRLDVTSEMDLRAALEGVGLEGVWAEGGNTYISDPPAVPSTVIQRVTVKLDGPGLDSGPGPGLTSLVTGLAGAVGRDFVANRPFVYGLVDSLTRTWLFSGAFSRP